MHSFSKEYSVPCSNESIQITMEKMTLIFCWTSLKAACPILCLFWSVSLHHLCLVLNRLDTIRDSSTPDPVFKLNSTERQTLFSLRGKGKKNNRTFPVPSTFIFLKTINMIWEWDSTHEQEFRTQEIMSFYSTIISHMGGHFQAIYQNSQAVF